MTSGQREYTRVASLTADLRRRVAMGEDTPPAVLERLVEDPDQQVRLAVGGNPSANARTLVSFFNQCTTSWELQAVALNPSCFDELLHVAATSPAIAARIPLPAGVGERIRSTFEARLCERLDVRSDNVVVIAALAKQRWWDMEPESVEVLLLKAVHPDL